MDLGSVFGLEKLEQQQEKDRAEEERAREVELKEFLARELPEDLLDETYSETSSEVSGLAEDHAPRLAAVLTHQLKLEEIPARQQPDSQPRFSDEQFFHSGQLQVASTPSVAKEAWAPDQLISPLSVSREGPLQPLSGEESEELLRLRILNEARSGEIRTLQEQLQQLQTQHGIQVQQLQTEYGQHMQQLTDQLMAEREASSQRETQASHVSHLQQQLKKSEKMSVGLREENMRMGEELQSALVHLDNCKSQLETLCRADVLERLRDQHVSLIQQSDILHRDELVRVKEEMDSLSASYQGTIRRMEQEVSQQNGEYLREIGRMEQELERSGRLSDQLRKEVDESELVSRVQQLESELSDSNTRERDMLDENKQLELMLASLRTRCSEAEVQRERVARERDAVSQEMREKRVEAETVMKDGLEKCRSACLLLHEESCNRLREKSAQEQQLNKEMHEREVNRLSEEITNLKQKLANKEGTISLQEQLALREMHEREINRLSEEITNLKQQLANKEGTVSLQEQLALREMHEREINRLSEEITNLKQQLANKEGTVSLQEQLALREMHEREVNRLSEEITNLKQQLANKEGTISLQEQLALREMHEREVNRLSEEITNLKQQLANKDGTVSALQAVLTKRVGTIEKLERELADRESVTLSNIQTAGCIRDAAEREIGDVEVHRNALYIDQQTDRSMRDDTSIRKYKREISQLREHIAKLETEFSKAISNQRSLQERDIRTLSEERNEIYASTLETIRCAFREALSSPGIHEAMPGQFDLPLLEFYPSPHGTPALEFSSLLREYLQGALLSLLRPVCSETNAASDSNRKVQQAVSLALEHAKRQYMKSFSELKSSLTAKYTEKIAGLSEGWEHERESLAGKLEESRETGLQLKRRIKECELKAESDKRRLKECVLTAENVKRTLSDQLSLLQEQLMYAETAHRKSVQELSQRFARSVTERRDQACQTDSSDKRYRELFERLLTDLQRETEGVVNKKLAIIEEARRQETDNARRMLDHNDQFLRRCRQVINAGKRGAIQDFHSSI